MRVVIYGEKGMILDTEAVECGADGPHLFFKIRRDLWGTPSPGELLVYAHTGTLRGRELDQFSFVDFTGLTLVRVDPKRRGANASKTEKQQVLP